MRYQINGYTDMYTVIANERKVGGAVEASLIRLRTGEEFLNAVITRMEMSGTHFCSVGFVCDKGQRMIVHVNDISLISNARHVRVCELTNSIMREQKVAERLKALKRLCEVNEGADTLPFREEAARLADDISLDLALQHVDLPFLQEEATHKVIRIA